ncbi:hypothetical protein AVHM3334_06570 [Acidovorax sp. SUPP3334]|nr:hypothetical protein AVHM3334_06570 [Acidovorax sp. SUPP3334]
MRILIFVVCLALAGCYPIHDESNCQDEIILSKNSPDGQFTATAALRSCGSTTSIAKIIYLKKINTKTNEEDKYGERIFVTTAEVEPSFQWQNDLLIINSPKLRNDIFISKDEWKNIKIIYAQ